MANILNPEIQSTRFFDDKKEIVTSDLSSNQSGGMMSEIEDNMAQIAVVANQTAKSRVATYDWKTKNVSFLNLYNNLYKLGIKNNKFFLKIYDRDLIGVDIYKDVIPIDLQMKVVLEILINPWYFLREVCRIPEDGSPIEQIGRAHV